MKDLNGDKKVRAGIGCSAYRIALMYCHNREHNDKENLVAAVIQMSLIPLLKALHIMLERILKDTLVHFNVAKVATIHLQVMNVCNGTTFYNVV